MLSTGYPDVNSILALPPILDTRVQPPASGNLIDGTNIVDYTIHY